MKPAVRLAQTWFLVSVVPLCVFIFSRLEIQMKCRSVSAQTHTPPLPPLSSLSTLALILPLVPLSSSLHLWMSGFLFRFASFCRTLKRRWDGVTEESEERFSLFVSAELRCGERRWFLFFRCRLDQTLRDCVFPEIDDRTFVHFTSRITVFPGFLSTSQFSDRLAENKNANLNRSCVSFRCKPLSFAFQFEALVIRWDFMLMFGWSLSGPSLHLWTAFNAD